MATVIEDIWHVGVKYIFLIERWKEACLKISTQKFGFEKHLSVSSILYNSVVTSVAAYVKFQTKTNQQTWWTKTESLVKSFIVNKLKYPLSSGQRGFIMWPSNEKDTVVAVETTQANCIVLTIQHLIFAF